MAQRSMIIVGAGVGGLAAGCYARMNGYDAHILEMGERPGGCCTSWRRGDYVFDGCLHNLGGTDFGSALNMMWRELGVVPQLRMGAFAEQVAVERDQGDPLILYADLDRLSAHLKTLAPADADRIDRLIAGARFFAGFDMMGLALAGPAKRYAALLRMLPLALHWRSMTLGDLAKRFNHPFLRAAIPRLIYDWPEQSVLMLLYFMGRLSVGDLGWVEGGSAALSAAIGKRFAQLGGTIRYGARVQSIIVEGDRAVGVRLADGNEERADIIVSDADGRTTIFDMLGGRYASHKQRLFYSRPEDRVEMGVHVSFGVDAAFTSEPHAIVIPLDPPTEIDREVRDRLFVQIFNHDRSYAPPGKTVVKVLLGTSFNRWERLAADAAAYQAAKDRILGAVGAALERRFPGFLDAVEVADVATPITSLRFTGAGQGYEDSMSGVMSSLFLGRRRGRSLPGLADFYQVGQWAGVPGVPFVAADGRNLVKALCRKEGRPFVARWPSDAEAPHPAFAALA